MFYAIIFIFQFHLGIHVHANLIVFQGGPNNTQPQYYPYGPHYPTPPYPHHHPQHPSHIHPGGPTHGTPPPPPQNSCNSHPSGPVHPQGKINVYSSKICTMSLENCQCSNFTATRWHLHLQVFQVNLN